MLVLAREEGQEIVIGEGADQVRVMLVTIRKGTKAVLGIEAPGHIPVHRREVWERIRAGEAPKRKKEEREPA